MSDLRGLKWLLYLIFVRQELSEAPDPLHSPEALHIALLNQLDDGLVGQPELLQEDVHIQAPLPIQQIDLLKKKKWTTRSRGWPG